MRKYFLIIAILGIALQGTLHDLYGQSAPFNQSDYGYGTGPMPFDEIGHQAVDKKSSAAVSTGYMFMSNQSSYGHPMYQWGPTDYRTTYPNVIMSQGGYGGLMSTEFEPNLWHRVYPGYFSTPIDERERLTPQNTIGLPLNSLGAEYMPREGFRYFRNPAQRFDYTAEYSPAAIDSTHNSFAGPIPIGFAFYMNGLRYDSFYVSTCGIIALSNRRYFYDGDGNRVVPPNESDCYDPNSADWPFRSLNGSAHDAVAENAIDVDMGRYQSGRGNPVTSLLDGTDDNYGFLNIACGGDPGNYASPIDNPTGGIRGFMTGVDYPADAPVEIPSMMIRLNSPYVSGGAYITPFEGPFYMPQTNKGVSDDRGKVWYKRNAAGNNLIIYFENFHMQAGDYERTGATNNPIIYRIVEGRVGETEGIDGVLEGSVQVELNGLDNSITFRYGDWRPSGSGYNIYGETRDQNAVRDSKAPWDFFQPFASIAVGGYARHRGYDTKGGPSYGDMVDANNPWQGQYAQWTNFALGYLGNSLDTRLWKGELLGNTYSLKFRQWRNALRLVDVQYKMRPWDPGATAFTKDLNTAASSNIEDPIELLAGHAQLGQLRPMVLVQNLTNDIQGPEGVNFVEQDFQFQAHVRIANKITEKIIYNRVAKIADTCLRDFNVDPNGFSRQELKTAYCGAEQAVWTNVSKDMAGNYISAPWQNDQYTGDAIGGTYHNGISPYNYVQVVFPTFVPNRNVSDQLGLMELTTFTDATHPLTGAAIGDEWTLDDTSSTSFWVISNVPDFRSNGEYHFHPLTGSLPDITKWVHSSISAGNSSVRVVAGGISANYSYNPLPPLGNFRPVNDAMTTILNPMYQFGSSKAAPGNWSKLTSFPVDLRNNTGSMVSLAVQKGEHSLSKNRGFSDNQIIGPEARVFFDIDGRRARYMHESGMMTSSGRATGFGGGVASNNQQDYETYPDYLFVEYLSPSPDNVKNIVSSGIDASIDAASNVNNSTYMWNGSTNSDGINNALWRGHRAYNAINGTFTPATVSYKHSPALAVFGGGGYYLGWTFADGVTFYPANWNNSLGTAKDAFGGSNVVTLNTTTGLYQNALWAGRVNALTEADVIVAGLMPNPYDVGFDDQFYRYSVVIPDYYVVPTVASQTSDPGENFRFRIRVVDVAAKFESQYPVGAAKGMQNNPQDDEDIFLVDNVAVVKQTPTPDIEMQAVNIVWPYLSAPINQATDLQVISRLTNMGNAAARGFNVKVRVYRGELGGAAPIDINSAIYCQSINVQGLEKGDMREVTASGLNLGEFATNTFPGSENIFTVQAIVNTNRADQYALNDTIYSHFTLTIDTVMKYVSSTTNEVQTEANLSGKGLNLGAHSIGGYMQSESRQDWAPTRNGSFRLSNPSAPHGGLYMNFWDGNLPRISYVSGGNIDDIYPGNNHDFISGQLAVKFEIRQTDSVRGVIAQFGSANQAFDDISFNIYTDNEGLPGAQVTTDVPLPLLARRLYAKSATGTETFAGPDVPVLYEFARPVSLPEGTYWVSIDQRGETGFEVAATGESMGMRTMIVHARGNQTENAPLGNEGLQLLLDRRLRVAVDDPEFGRVYENNNIFAYRNIMHSSSNWQPFMPTIGQIAYPHLNHFGMLNEQRNNYQTFTRGTWAPLVVPYFGAKTVAANNNTAICPDEIGTGGGDEMAINITSFVGVSRQAGIELFWEAISTNDNNSHFIIERQEADEVNTWTEVERALGSVEKSTVKSHKSLDSNVTAGKTYRYRLYQMYDDGSLTCQNSHTVTVAYNPEYSIDLAQNSPNPFNSQTNIDVTVPTEEYVTLEIIDIFGNVVKTLAANELLHGQKRYVWNGDSNTGVQVSNGHYMYRLTAGTETITKKLTLLRSN